ncbi:MAG: copper chaperone PCu(A)C [Anaerolineae bacterium]|nr:copper chaperone PCu(A)C [Anaerolineae bacterium]MCO5189214.1 copper chaperone PCu(A)C [Anaerolineae bacterium]MCO5192025.1 copper chaperone PCu(A)C [Anaerolineae bacterium]MCO5199420.1 copper chaperone PCu(A)C [Anaerolineae bacterium]MCO5206053.1 copper chaperone PCu(A)C [Anaerolineae bacterium]
MNYSKWVILILLVVGLVACSTATGELEVTDVWGRNSPAAADNGAFYMTITNESGQDDKLVAVSADVCDVVELHEMYMKENDVMGMRPVEGGAIVIPDGETVELKVGGLHVMCLGKTESFELGNEYPLTLTFENAGDMAVTAAILQAPPVAQ